MKLWSGIRVRTYKAALKRPTPPTLAILKIPSIHLEVPVHDGTSDAVLDLAAGRIEDTALPGTPGNVGIAAHRDGYFRALKDIKEGDELVLETPVATEQYRVEWIKITVPTDVSVIAATPGPAVTLVGCYPFYHRGPGPAAVHRARGARDSLDRDSGARGQLTAPRRAGPFRAPAAARTRIRCPPCARRRRPSARARGPSVGRTPWRRRSQP